MRSPNKRVQRTRLRSPLTRRPLGAGSLLAATVCFVAAAAPSLAGSAGGASALAGCYEFQQGAWVPALDLGGNAKYVVIPKTAELTLHLVDQSDKSTFAARALSPVPSGGQRAGFWRQESKGRLFLNWTDGFVGVSMILEDKEDRLAGIAQTHWDVQGSQLQNASIAARRIPCPAATPRRSK